ncbi:MAG TPA: M15 family metallopeptidase [Actinomycetota bacterium]|nr:M15 family metallopeptidase [Actinomycetota bacterium]
MTVRRMSGNIAAALVGAIVGATLVLSIEGATRDIVRDRVDAPRRDPAAIDIGVPRDGVDPQRTVLLAWAPGGLPSGAERAVERLTGVLDATTVRAGLDWIQSSRLAGSVHDDPDTGFAIPFEVAFVDPHEYARYVPPSERPAVLALRPGEALLAETSARLRAQNTAVARMTGLRIQLRNADAQVTDVVSDVATQGYEALLAGNPPSWWKRMDRFLLMRVRARAAQRTVTRALGRMLSPGQSLRIRAQGETPFLRYGDAVLPQLHMKATFGEFAARSDGDGTITVSPEWREQNITSRSVPLLGKVTCHRALFPQLEAALEQVERSGLAFTIDAGDFGGCYSPRFIDSDPDGRISHHSWGVAIDLNVAENRPGTQPDIDHRVVRIMERHGFTWGGRWLVPDGMHFEWVRFP